MQRLGYDKHEMFRKGRFRPATFWRSNRVTQYGSSMHRDRCLVTAFHPTSEIFSDVALPSELPQDTNPTHTPTLCTTPLEIIWLANCHLSAGGGVERNIRYKVEFCIIRKSNSNNNSNVTLTTFRHSDYHHQLWV